MGWNHTFNFTKKIVDEGTNFTGAVAFTIKGGSNVNYRIPATGALTCTNGLISPTSSVHFYDPELNAAGHMIDLVSIELNGVVKTNLSSQDNEAFQQGNDTVSWVKDIYIIDAIIYAGGYSTSLGVTLYSNEVPESTDAIMRINGDSDVATSNFSGGTCDLTYSGNIIFFDVRLGDNGPVLFAETLTSGDPFNEAYNITEEEVQGFGGFKIFREGGVTKIKSDHLQDIVKIKIYK